MELLTRTERLPKDVLDLQSMSRGEIELVLQNAAALKEILGRPIKKVPALRGKSICTLFYEPSTRTRTSFEMAAKILSGDAINIATSTSSAVKGESLKDTVLTLEALGLDLLVIRHPLSGAPALAARYVSIPVVNAGDGTHEHPTQGLLDLFTLREAKGHVDGLRVAIIGDIAHSRVARSNLWGLARLGAEVRLAGPATLMPPGIETTGARLCASVEDAVRDADVVYVLRIQLERQQGGLLPTLREYSERFGLTARRLERAQPDVIVMHPGPMNRGVEIAADVADAGYSVITDQVTNGVAVRMAVLYLLLGGGTEMV